MVVFHFYFLFVSHTQFTAVYLQDMVAAESRKIELDAELLKDVALIHNNGRYYSWEGVRRVEGVG